MGVCNGRNFLCYWFQATCVNCVPIVVNIYQKSQNRLLRAFYVPATSAVLIAFFFAAAINSTNEANQAANTRH
jgi:uncharacterized pyridoxamine 5'-phosphate oxidase family protein